MGEELEAPLDNSTDNCIRKAREKRILIATCLSETFTINSLYEFCVARNLFPMRICCNSSSYSLYPVYSLAAKSIS